MAYDNKGGVNNALKYFNDGGEYNKPLKKAQFNNSEIVPMTVTNRRKLTDAEKLELHDEKAKRFLNKKNKKGPFKGGKTKLKPYN